MEPFIGHERVIALFDRLVASDRLSHGYCFIGLSGLGKRTFAEHLARQLLGITNGTLETHPDFFMVKQEMNEKTGKTKERVDIDQIREVKEFCAQSPLVSKKKVVLIDDAERLTISAANALLKTLEEPRPGRHLFLVTSEEEAIPATIRSRCHSIYFAPVSKALLIEKTRAAGYGDGMAERMAQQAEGRPGWLFDWLNDSEAFQLYLKEEERFIGLVGEPLYEKMKRIEDILEKEKDTVKARGQQEVVIARWRLMLRTLLRCRLEGDIPPDSWQGKTGFFPESCAILKAEAALRRGAELLARHVNARLVFEDIFLHIP